MSYYIKGNIKRGSEVITLLKSKGGKNINHLFGDSEHCFYYIDKNNIIQYDSFDHLLRINDFCEELTLPKTWEPKFKVGDYVVTPTKNIVEITAINITGYDIKYPNKTVLSNFTESLLTLWEPTRSVHVLVRNDFDNPWVEAVFSYKSSSTFRPYATVGGAFWNFCIPFDEDKLGKIK